jgi:cobalt/nickel transport system ATP-binding protein
MLEVKDLWFKYEKDYVLKGISFKADRGVTVIMGRNGSGKTTLLLNLIGILKPNRGKIIIDGKELKYDRKSLKELRKKATLVFQNPDDQIIAPTVWQEVAFGAKNAGKDFERLSKEAIEICNLKGLENFPCSILSGGMKKLLTIASAIAMDPEIILMDEPTAGLDGVAFRKLVNIIKILKERGKTILISTHDYDLAREVGDKFIFLNDGKVVYEGKGIRKDIARKIGVRLGEMEVKKTKDEIIGIVFSKFKPKGDEVFADIGCGTGSVSAFFARFVKKVYAIDENKEAYELAKEKLKNLENVEVLQMKGEDFLKKYDCDFVFFGGTRDIDKMLEVCRAKKIVVNAARIEVAIAVMNKMRELGIFKEMVIANISRSYELANATAFKSENPVFIIFGSRE